MGESAFVVRVSLSFTSPSPPSSIPLSRFSLTRFSPFDRSSRRHLNPLEIVARPLVSIFFMPDRKPTFNFRPFYR